MKNFDELINEAWSGRAPTLPAPRTTPTRAEAMRAYHQVIDRHLKDTNMGPITHNDRVASARNGIIPTAGHTRGEFVDELAFVEAYAANLRRTVAQWPAKLTDYVEIKLNSGSTYVYHVRSQHERRVQVGDLITTPALGTGSGARVARVTKINVAQPTGIVVKPAVAISPEDAQRITRVLGTIR